jgi:isoleucyl-tRNA synthetase
LHAQKVFGWVLHVLVRVMAPVTPFITETIYQNLVANPDSLHLSAWPDTDTRAIDTKLEEDMVQVQQIVERAHAKRKELAIKLRQPLASATITTNARLSDELLDVIKEEINVLGVVVQEHEGLDVQFDTTMTEELTLLGLARELIREIQVARKEKGCKIDERISVAVPARYNVLNKEHLAQVQGETLVDAIVWHEETSVSITKSQTK